MSRAARVESRSSASSGEGASGEGRQRPTRADHDPPLWRIRLAREAPRYLLLALSLAGLAASARFAIAPPRPRGPGRGADRSRAPDRAAEGYAALFARRYLTWNAAEPQASARALAPFVGPGMEPDAGLRAPAER